MELPGEKQARPCFLPCFLPQIAFSSHVFLRKSDVETCPALFSPILPPGVKSIDRGWASLLERHIPPSPQSRFGSDLVRAWFVWFGFLVRLVRAVRPFGSGLVRGWFVWFGSASVSLRSAERHESARSQRPVPTRNLNAGPLVGRAMRTGTCSVHFSRNFMKQVVFGPAFSHGPWIARWTMPGSSVQRALRA